MYVESVSLKQMRNYNEIKVALVDGVNVLYGANAQGKTNFLESVYFCATGRSPRTHADKELIQFGKNETLMRVSVIRDRSRDRIDAHIRKDSGKGMAVNGVPVKKLSELFGILLTVIFSPEDLLLVKAGPSERRKFVDMELCQLSAVYYYELQQYYKALKQRNVLLKNIVKNRDLKETIFVWDEQLFEHGKRIIDYREGFVRRLYDIARKIHSDITGGEKLEILYKPSVSKKEFMEKLVKNLERDIMLGSTSAGIHKDEVVFLINGHDARMFGSQGQQRTASISAKLAEISLIKEEKGETPVLLLDDVFSELDKKRQLQLMDKISDLQTILTCTGVEDVLANLQGSGAGNLNVCRYNVTSGTITPDR